jgi:3-hydroxy-9,10-secoandrosta-1,3,5(10)-triene-9,17-dione monooxygenase reductase component
VKQEDGMNAGELARDPVVFRHVLGHYPTGVCLITAMGRDGEPIGLVVGSFTSASLDPPLVAFFPDRRSPSWHQIADAGRFCVNVLAEHQEDICRRFTAKVANRFEGANYRLSESGLQILDEVVAWIECDLHAVLDAGDHFVALGQVKALDVEHPGAPLLLCKGGYGQFAAAAAARQPG